MCVQKLSRDVEAEGKKEADERKGRKEVIMVEDEEIGAEEEIVGVEMVIVVEGEMEGEGEMGADRAGGNGE